MMPSEYNTVDPSLLKQVARKWSGKRINFEITRCSVWWHTDVTGAQMWLLGFNITCKDLLKIRSDLKLVYSKKYKPHMVALEYVVGYKK